MSTKTSRKGGQWVLFAWLFIFLLMLLLWLFYYDWGGNDISEEKTNHKIIADNEVSFQPPYEPAENKSIAVGETFIVSNGTIILTPDKGHIEIDQYTEKESQPLLTVDVFPEKHNGDTQ